jgi:hypothetical protein
MAARLVLLAAVLIVLGTSLISAPIDEGDVSSTTLSSGLWQDVALPNSGSWTGSPDTLELSWGALPNPCGYYWRACAGPAPPPLTYLKVYDCGPAPCDSRPIYPFVLSTGEAFGGHVELNATPGEHFQVWAFVDSFAPQNTTISLRHAVDGPVFDGVLGAAMAGLGVEVAVVAMLPHRDGRRDSRLLASRF